MKESAVCGEMCERETFNRIEKVRTILRIRLEYLHHIGHQIRQLLIDFDFLQILFYPRSLSPTFVRNALHIGFHDANVTGEEMDICRVSSSSIGASSSAAGSACLDSSPSAPSPQMSSPSKSSELILVDRILSLGVATVVSILYY
jgi:hypothetical protein